MEFEQIKKNLIEKLEETTEKDTQSFKFEDSRLILEFLDCIVSIEEKLSKINYSQRAMKLTEEQHALRQNFSAPLFGQQDEV
jgi:hypothetical protein